MTGGNSLFGHDLPQPGGFFKPRIVNYAALEGGIKGIEARYFIFRGEVWIIGDIVRRPRKSIINGDAVTQASRQ